MNQHHQPPGPPPNPFEGDLLERQPTVERYTAPLEQTERPCVLALYGGLGAGKTTFIGFWEKYLSIKGFDTTTFKVWEQGLTPQGLASKIDQIPHEHTERRFPVVFIDELDHCLTSPIDEFFRHLGPVFRKGNHAFVLAIALNPRLTGATDFHPCG